VQLEGSGKFKKIHHIGTRTHDLPACSIVPQQTTRLEIKFTNTAYVFKIYSHIKLKDPTPTVTNFTPSPKFTSSHRHHVGQKVRKYKCVVACSDMMIIRKHPSIVSEIIAREWTQTYTMITQA
jgi:hypothetical protein